MKKRPYGKTGKQVSEIGFGAWQLGNAKDWGDTPSLEEGIQLVHEAIDSGVNFFDTSPNYGLGKSETILGKALKNRRDQVVINTKFGHHVNGELNFDADQIKRSIEGSLERLQTDYLDSILLHNPPREIIEGKTQHFKVLEDLKREGLIHAYGASVDFSEDMNLLMENSDCDLIETMFNIFHQETRQAFDKANENGVGLIIKVPLDSGWLSGKYNHNTKFNDIRSRWSKETLERRFSLLEKIKFISNNDRTLAQAALQFILSYNEVSTVIPGAKNVKQLHENIKSANHQMSKETVHKLEAIYENELKNHLLNW